MFGFSKGCGHKDAATWVTTNVDKAFSQREKRGPPTKLMEIVDLLSPEQVYRLQRGQVLHRHINRPQALPLIDNSVAAFHFATSSLSI